MKKKLEADLMSIAHRVLQIKNKSDVNKLYLETQKLYEKLSVLRFVEEYFGDVRAGAVRGGVRGSAITPEFVAYEQRQAAVMGMPLKAWADSSARV